MSGTTNRNIGVLTSGGDAQGMNAAVRSVVRCGLHAGVKVYAIYEGYQGMVDGGERIREMTWDSVGGILHQGGTAIGSARCLDFREKEGRRKAAKNLVERGIDSLVVCGGDGSLTGANLFRQEWPELIKELLDGGEISKAVADVHPDLAIVGMVGSIDNDMFGTDMTIGADSALHRITEAIDAITSTAASHQRSFVVEVMGRNCGYLALMAGIATAADWVLIPESPPEGDDWEQSMCDALQAGRDAGRRDNIVLVAEGATDRQGKPIEASYIVKVLQDRLGQDVRLTILGHVQRGGSPSAYDRYMSTALGHAAVEQILAGGVDEEPQLVGMSGNRVTSAPLMECVRQTHALGKMLEKQQYEEALAARGPGFVRSWDILKTLVRARPRSPQPGQTRLRLAVVNAGGPAPGMNTATRAAVRLGLDRGHTMLGVSGGFRGLVDSDIEVMDWDSVGGWASRGGSELGTSRFVPDQEDFYTLARSLEDRQIQGLLVIGGWAGYKAAHAMVEHRNSFKAFNIPIVCMPASIDNNLPGSEISVGADTALNNIVQVVDKIKQSAVATHRTFVVEVMGRYCGYLALLSGLATGAERVYLHEEGVTLKDLQADVERLRQDFNTGKRLGLMIRNEEANRVYSTGFMTALFEEEGGELFEVRQSILGHMQQGGDPSPFDRIFATEFATQSVDYLIEKAAANSADAGFIGFDDGAIRMHNLEDFPRMVDQAWERPRTQWWMSLRPIARLLARTKLETAA